MIDIDVNDVFVAVVPVPEVCSSLSIRRKRFTLFTCFHTWIGCRHTMGKQRSCIRGLSQETHQGICTLGLLRSILHCYANPRRSCRQSHSGPGGVGWLIHLEWSVS